MRLGELKGSDWCAQIARLWNFPSCMIALMSRGSVGRHDADTSASKDNSVFHDDSSLGRLLRCSTRTGPAERREMRKHYYSARDTTEPAGWHDGLVASARCAQ